MNKILSWGLAAALLAVQVIPALAVSYRTPKDDYRAVVQHVTAVSPPGTTWGAKAA